MNRRKLRVGVGVVVFAVWVVCAVLVIRYDLAHDSFGLRTVIIVLVTGFLASMRLARAWFNEPDPE